VGYLPAVQNLFLWSLLAKVVPTAPIGRSIHIGRSTDGALRRDRVLICSDSSLLPLPMDDGGLCTAALDEHKVNALP
jgi:hypothetical protein